MNKIPLVFFGNERIATGVTTTAPTLQALIHAGYDIKAVVSNYERGTSRSARELEIKAVADAHKIPVLLPDKPGDILGELKSFNAEAAVLVAYGRIVPQSVIDIFPKGIINIHPSLLPLHRGPTPLESVILDDSKKTGVSVMRLAKAMDAGPVYGQSEVELSGSETKQELADQLLDIGSAMVIELLPGILSGDVIAKPQDDSFATYDSLITKDNGRIDWTKPADQLVREIRAYAEWPKSTATFTGKDLIIITKAHAIAGDKKTKPGTVEVLGRDLIFYCGKGALVTELLKPAGKKEMTTKEFLDGYYNNKNK